MRLKAAWFFIERWNDVVWIIIVSLIVFLFALHMMDQSDTAMILFYVAK
jgi:hypothetical protein